MLNQLSMKAAMNTNRRPSRAGTRGLRPAALALALFAGLLGFSTQAAEPAPIDFNRQIRPILSNHCFKCHGPDVNQLQAGLRLDQRERATAKLESGATAIVPRDAKASAVAARIQATDPGEIMPPPAANKPLSDAQKQLLTRWIEEGAEYREHWAFVPPQRPEPPPVKTADRARNGIDRFLLARLERDGMSFSPEATKEALIRRVTLDLTGLPPTLAEIDAFLADTTAGAYEKVVDRLMRSPHYGERLALDWLDAARFADTHGYHIDSGRDMTRWREWVIGAFAQDMPFDRFTVEQLAGDLLPDATVSQRVASGFNRNHMINFEGGAVPQEYQNAYIVDRVNTTATVWLGLTLNCTQCHDHKYDPFTQREFYQLYAFFHNLPENGLDGSKGNAAPLLKAPSPEQETTLAELTRGIAEREKQLAGPHEELDREQAAFESDRGTSAAPAWRLLAPASMKSAGGATLEKLEDGSIVAQGKNPDRESYVVSSSTGELKRVTAIRVELLPDARFTAQGPGRSINGNVVLTDVRVAIRVAGAPARALKLQSASADFSQKDYPVANAIDGNPASGWAIYPEVGKPHQAVFELSEPLVVENAELEVTLDCQSQFANHQPGRFRLSATDSREPHIGGELPEPIRAALAVKAAERTDAQRNELRAWYRANKSPLGRKLTAQQAEMKQKLADLDKVIPTAMVMQEMPQPRDTFVLIRGAYDKPGDKVVAAVPAALPPLRAGAPANRLGLATWLVDRGHPLTARVTINRYWQMLFGTGLVKTSDDFGSQGEPPTHGELLDWLAVEFMEPSAAPLGSGSRTPWDLGAMIRMMVTSSAYRQSARVAPEHLAKDPENRLLTRGPRFRLQAEFIRDLALATSGLLDRRIGGASVSPYQPAGLWEELMSREDGANWTAQRYTQSHGADLYRRSMYTFWKRTCPPPTMATFDAPDRETCTVRRARTNTPLQALITLNDPTYVEASRKFAERILAEGGESLAARATFAFRTAVGRNPGPKEQRVLTRQYERQLARYRADVEAAKKLLSVGEAPRDERFDAAEVCAWAMVAGTILNLDETLTK